MITVGDIDKEDEDVSFQLTEYGEKVWRVKMFVTTSELKRP